MKQWAWMVVVAASAGCATHFEPIGDVGGSGGAAGHGGGAGIGGFAGDGFRVDGGGGVAGGQYVGGEGGYGGYGGGYAGSGGNPCDTNDPCVRGFFQPDDGSCHFEHDPNCGGYAGTGGGGYYVGGEGGYGGYAGNGPFPVDAGIGGYGGYGGGNPCDTNDPCVRGFLLHNGACYFEHDPYCGGAGVGGVGGYGGVGGGTAGSGGYAGNGPFPVDAGIGGYGGGPCDNTFVDEDNDGYFAGNCGGDCDDLDPDVFPYQQSFFTTPRDSGSFDFDCDELTTLRWGTVHTTCSVDSSGQACRGSGWTPPGNGAQASIPGCGQQASYTFCQFTGSGCASSTHTVTQACR